jgi:hypothetical protein
LTQITLISQITADFLFAIGNARVSSIKATCLALIEHVRPVRGEPVES